MDAVDHNVLVAPCESRVYDLNTVTEAELLDIVMPLNFVVRALVRDLFGKYKLLRRLRQPSVNHVMGHPCLCDAHGPLMPSPLCWQPKTNDQHASMRNSTLGQDTCRSQQN